MQLENLVYVACKDGLIKLIKVSIKTQIFHTKQKSQAKLPKYAGLYADNVTASRKRCPFSSRF